MPNVYEIYVQKHFSMAHTLGEWRIDYTQIQGEVWIVEVFVRCQDLGKIDIGIDFGKIKKAVKGELDRLDHSNLAEKTFFASKKPTPENVAKYLYREIGRKINSEQVSVSKVKVGDTSNAGVFYWED